ncbi:MAG TPA: Gfo/Idh/MocA family oxidoreductase [Chloroflexota bacterium]|nr:Gfo/Idh/MocA family oxidoreductase [Chloroflexota bacterium]
MSSPSGILDVAVIGAGSRGATHLDTITALTDRFRLVGVCDAREERRAWAKETYGASTFDNPLTLLDHTKPHAVAVVIPPDAHHLITAAAAARGVHVLCETPMASTRAMCDAMISAAQRHGVVLEISENVWRFSQERLKRLAVEAGLIGTVQQVHLWYRSGSYHGMSALRRFITARPTRILGLTREVPVAPYKDLDGAVRRRQSWELGAIDFGDSGANGSMRQFAVYQLPVGSDRGNLWEVVGDRGALMGTDLIVFDGPDGARRRVQMETITDETSDGKKVLAALRYAPGQGLPTVEWENPHRRYGTPGSDDVARADIYTALHDAITSGAPPTPMTDGWPETPPTDARFYGPQNARADLELLMALRESAARGNAWLELPLTRGEDTTFERRLHDEFEGAYGAPPFSDPEALLAKLFPRRGLATAIGNVIA